MVSSSHDAKFIPIGRFLEKVLHLDKRIIIDRVLLNFYLQSGFVKFG